MNLLQQTQIQTSVYICTFECFIRQANIAMKFPCTYFVEWRTVNAKTVAKTERHSPQQNTVIFEEKITLAVEMLYDHSKLEFLKRETIVELYLISKSRPDQNKLVGRVNIDLGKVINVGMYEPPTEFKLNFCSIEGILIMQFKAIDQRLTSLAIQDLDKSSFIDFISQNALKNQTRNQSAILTRLESQSIQRKSLEKSSRSQIKSSTYLQKKESIIKSSIITKGNPALKNEFEKKLFSSEQEQINEMSRSLNRLNDESQAKSKIIANNQKVKTEEASNEAFNHQIKLIHGKNQRQSNDYNKKQDEIVISQTITFENLNRKTSSKLLERNLRTEDVVLKEVKQSNAQILINKQAEMQKVLLALDEKDQLLANYHLQNKKLKGECNNLIHEKNELLQAKASSDELAKRLEDETRQIGRLQQEIATKNKIIEQFDSQLNSKELLVHNLEKELEKVRQQYSSSNSEELKLKISSLQSANAQITQKKNQFEQQLADYAKKIAMSQQSIQKLQKQHSQCLQRINLSITSENQMKSKLQELQIENNQLVGTLESLRREYEQKMTESDMKKSTNFEKHQQELLQLEAQIARYENHLEQAVQRYEAAEKELNYIQGKYLQLENMYDEQANNQDLLQQRLHTNAEPVEGFPSNLSQVVEKVEQIKEEHNDLQKLKEENESLNNQIEFLKANSEMIERQARDAIETLRSQNESFKQQLLSLENKLLAVQQLNSRISELEINNTELTNENNALKESIDHLNKQIEGEDPNQMKLLQLENLQLREQGKSIEAQVQFYENELIFLKNEITRIKQIREVKETPKQSANLEQKFSEYQEMIGKLNGNLEQQINQNNELSQAIVRYMQKQAKMKQTLAVLQKQSKEIFTLVQQKEQNEQTYQKAIEELQCELLLNRNGQQTNRGSDPKTQDQQDPQSQQYRHEDQSHNDELLKLQEKLLDENAELAHASNNLREANIKLNEDLMGLSLEHNEIKLKFEEEVSYLNQRITSLEKEYKKQEDLHSNTLKQFERSLKNKEIEIQIWKSRSKERESLQHDLELEVNRLRTCLEEIEEEKFNLESSNNEKDIKILELQEELNGMATTLVEQSTPKEISSNAHVELLSQLKERLLQRNMNSDWDSLLQSVLDRSILGQETSKLLNLQQKSRLLSKQLQKMKATLLKSDWRNQQQKIAAMGLFKKCQSIVTQLISSAESLNQNQSSFL